MVAETDYVADTLCLNWSKAINTVGNINNFDISSVREKSKCKFFICNGNIPFPYKRDTQYSWPYKAK
jgi:hypothetical protein